MKIVPVMRVMKPMPGQFATSAFDLEAARVAVDLSHLARCAELATRFGGAVKGAVEAFEGRSFLELKALQARRLGPVPLVVMNSFATRGPTAAHLRERELEDGVYAFVQSASLRLTRAGGLFRDDLNATINDASLRALAATEGPLTYTCVPPGSGTRRGIERDGDTLLDGFETGTGVFVSATDTGTSRCSSSR